MSRRLPAVKPKEVLRALGRAGSSFTTLQEVITFSSIPPNRICASQSLPQQGFETENSWSIIEQAGLTTDEFRDLL